MIYQEPFQPVNRFLALAVRGVRSPDEDNEIMELYHRLGFTVCNDAARNNKVWPLVAQALSGLISPYYLESCWQEGLEANRKRVMELIEAMTQVAKRLEAMGVRSAVIENGGVMLSAGMPLAAFCAGDFDLLVQGGRWEDIHGAFRSEGYVAKDRRNRPTNRVEFARQCPSGGIQWINLGYKSFDRMWMPLSYKDRSAVWLKRRVRAVAYPELHTLAPADSLALVAIHTSLHFFVLSPGIRLHVDIDRLVRGTEIDWDQFILEIRALGLPTRAFVSLAMSRGLLGTPIPEWVLTTLFPGRRRWDRIRTLLASGGTFYRSEGKLRFPRAWLLDFLLDERSFLHWLRDLLFPAPAWMRKHFGRTREANESDKGVNRLSDWLAVLYWRRMVARLKLRRDECL